MTEERSAYWVKFPLLVKIFHALGFPKPLPPYSASGMTPVSQPQGSYRWVWDLLMLVFLGVLSFFYWHLVDNRQMGFTHDDGVYAITAKSLAEGHGFKLAHVVGQPGEIKYPFFYPLVLSLVWFFQPHFPQNLVWMNALSVGFTVLACGLLYLYASRVHRFPGWLAILLTALVTSNFFFMYFSTSVMSEALYLLLSILTIYYVQRQSERQTPWTLQTVLLAVLLSVLTFQTRILGLTLMAAIATWLVLQRQWKNALLYGAGSFLFGVLPWILWVKWQTPPLNDLSYPLINAYSNYGLEFIHNYNGLDYLTGLRTDCFELISKQLEVMIPLIPDFVKLYPVFRSNPTVLQWRDVTALISMYLLFGYFVLQVISTFFKSVRDKRLNPSAFSISALYLVYYLLTITLWNYEDQLTRFLIIVTPFLWIYFFKPFLGPLGAQSAIIQSKPASSNETVSLASEVSQSSNFTRSDDAGFEDTINTPFLAFQSVTAPPASRPRWHKALAMVAILIITTAALWATPSSYKIIAVARQQHWVESGRAKWLWGEYEDSFSWIRRQLPANASLGVASDVVYYLYTQRPTFYVFYASLKRYHGKFTPDSVELLMKSLDHHHIQYLVVEPHMQFRMIQGPVNLVMKSLLESFPHRFKLLYVTPRGSIGIYRILPPASSASLHSRVRRVYAGETLPSSLR